MLLQNVTYILTFVGLGSLIGVSLLRGKSLQMRRFTVMVAAISVWLLLQWVAGLIGGQTGELLIRLSIGVSPFILLTFLIFILAYNGDALKQKYSMILFAICALFFILAATGVSVQGVEFDGSAPSITSVNFIYYIQILFIICVALYAVYKLLKKSNKDKTGADKLLLFSLIQALVVSVLVSTVFAASTQAQVLIPLSLLFMSLIIYYAIAKHRLFDIRFVIARAIAYSLSIAIVVSLFSVLSFALANVVFNANITVQQELFFAVFSAVIALAFQPIKRFFDKYTNKVFYRDAYDSQEIINSVNSKIVNTLELEELLQETADTVESMMRLAFADFYLDSSAAIEFHLAGTNTKLFANQHWSSFADEFSGYSGKLLVSTDDTIPEKLKELMQELSVEAAVKMTTTTDSVGYFVVGSRRSGNSLSDQDMQLLEIIADEVAIAVQNALRFEEISQFNVTLQKKIDDATRELQKSNEKLQKLDEAKDEFISMASHQLRTPLTSVKGYISMMLEGDAGDINDQQKNFLDQAFLSSQRMVYLIADLLNVSRLKTGKFIIEPKPTYLPDVVESEIAQLHETAKARDLKLIFDKPDSFPTLNLDETKIRQVIMNFADNAIYYTPKGGKITIGLKATDESIEYTVRDTGIGVPKSEQHHLFTKFYRAGNAKKARPDGTGLGLFMAKKVVVAQGGAIVFKTEEGKGSTFGFSFPRAKLEVAP